MPPTSTTPGRVIVAISPAAEFGRHHGAAAPVGDALRAAGHEVVELRQANFELLRREVEREMRAARDAHDAHAADAGTDACALVVVGGDGMVSLGANVVARTRIPLGVVPIGTGNDTARNIGMALGNPEAAAQQLVAALRHPFRAVDAALVTHGPHSTWVLGVVSAGFDAAVNERANLMSWPKSERRYTLATITELLRFRAPHYRLVVDGEARECDAMLVAVANHASIGGGMRIAPDAVMDDGLLELVVVERMSKLRFLRVFPSVFRGEHTGLPEVHIERVRQVRIESGGVPAYGDGERIGSPPIEVSVVPGAILLLHAAHQAPSAGDLDTR